ncbi:hypothetical protein GCM10022214_53660 [Actinomadura miaoliensis]|uniref:Uncharacterized protein n=1 Tax=Actinomadura miaoliensis TaxID=430685 RepID=A0ABP7WFQ1_9ACTN
MASVLEVGNAALQPGPWTRGRNVIALRAPAWGCARKGASVGRPALADRDLGLRIGPSVGWGDGYTLA